jgi:DNA-binding beta-propeller fold protein YncE
MLSSIARSLALVWLLAVVGCRQGESAPLPEAGAPAGEFAAPQGIAAAGRYLVVASSAFHYVDGKPAWGPGFVTVVERASRRIVAQIPTSAQNPQRVAARGETAYVVCSGTLALHDGLATPSSDGALDIFDLSAGPPARPTASIALGRSSADSRIGAYGAIAISPDGQRVFIGSGTRGDLFEINLGERRAARGPDQPIELFPTPSGKNGLTSVAQLGDEIVTLDFNSDSLCRSTDLAGHLAQRRCGTVGVQDDLLEGPIDVAQAPDGHLLVLMSIANSVYRVDTSSNPFAVESGFAKTGLSNSRIVVHDAFAYVVNSMSNNLQRIELSSGRSDLPFAVLPVKSNPYDLAITQEPEGEIAWVTLQGSNQVARVSLASGAVLSLLPEAGAQDAAPIARDGAGADVHSCPEAGLPAVVGIDSVEQLTIGEGGGGGKDLLPGAIQGGPSGSGSAGDVLSLGKGGEIIVGFGDYEIVDGPGPDFIVFENPFLVSPYNPYAEPAVVGVSATETAAESFLDFPCDLSQTQGDAAQKKWPYPGCAGVHPVLAGGTSCVSPIDAAAAGGDAFDLATVGLQRARFVRVRDAKLSTMGTTAAGFDLDAIVLIHYEKKR